MRPEEAETIRRFLLPQLRYEHAVTRRVLAAMPPEGGDYQPEPRSRSALRLAWHIVAVEMWFVDAVVGRSFGEAASKPEALKTGSDVAAWYQENFAERLPKLEALTGEELATRVDFLGLRNDPAVAYLNIAIRHSVHHRGQLSTYLRPMGGKVPAIYVESADEPFSAGPEEIAAGTVERPPAF